MDNLKKYSLGALRIKKENDYIAFSRFTKEQEDLFLKRGEAVSNRAFCTASVKLEFYTKGGNISFEYTVAPGNNREFYSIDLLVDSNYKYSISKNTDSDAGLFSYNIPDSESEQRITVYFPTTVCMKIKKLELPRDAAPHKRKTKILVLGDSLYQGYNPNHFQNTCMNILADSFDAEMINQAIGGDCFDEENLAELEYNADFIIVGYGINDWASGKFRNGEDARLYIEKLTQMYPQTPTFVVLPPNIDYLENTRKNDDLLFDTADSQYYNQTFDDIRNTLHKITENYKNIVPINARNFIQQYPECFYKDNVHLTDLGNILFGNRITEEIKKYYAKMGV